MDYLYPSRKRILNELEGGGGLKKQEKGKQITWNLSIDHHGKRAKQEGMATGRGAQFHQVNEMGKAEKRAGTTLLGIGRRKRKGD